MGAGHPYRFERFVVVAGSVFLSTLLQFGCGGGQTAGAEPATHGETTAPPAEQARTGENYERIQGRWEVARYESVDPVPDEAMPLMAVMFEELIIEFDEGRVRVGKDEVAYELDEQDGDAFTMRADGGMFHGARCRFVDDDTIEVDDQGPQWPGQTKLTRVE